MSSPTGSWFNIKMSYQHRKSHCGDKTILRPSYLHNGISYTGKMTSLYWIRAHNLSSPHPRYPSCSLPLLAPSHPTLATTPTLTHPAATLYACWVWRSLSATPHPPPAHCGLLAVDYRLWMTGGLPGWEWDWSWDCTATHPWDARGFAYSSWIYIESSDNRELFKEGTDQYW